MKTSLLKNIDRAVLKEVWSDEDNPAWQTYWGDYLLAQDAIDANRMWMFQFLKSPALIELYLRNGTFADRLSVRVAWAKVRGLL